MTDLAFFLEYEKRLAHQRAIEVASDPLVFAGIKKWAQLDISEKKLFIERYKRLCESAMNSGMLKLEFFEQAPTEGRIHFGSYHEIPDAGGWGRPVRINVHPEVLDKVEIRRLLSTPPHELTHNHQDNLIANPAILPELFRAPISQLMSENKARYIDSKSDYDGYRKQPLEVHAFIVGDAFAEAVVNFVASRNLLPNNFDEAEVRKEYEQAVNVKNGRGRIDIPTSDGLETVDPYRHHYFAKFEAVKLKRPGGWEYNRWWDIIKHNQKAVIYGEYRPYNPRPAMQEIYQLAANEFFDDDRSPPIQIQVPDALQSRARRVLEEFAATGRERESRVAKGLLAKLERLGPLPPAERAVRQPVRELHR